MGVGKGVTKGVTKRVKRGVTKRKRGVGEEPHRRVVRD